MKTETLLRAGEIWDYMSAIKTKEKSDAIVVCCSYDLRVCDYACDLVNEEYSDTLLISGNSGNWTRHIWDSPEAEVFCERALTNGIDENKILKEPNATNFGENITYSKAIIPSAKVVTFVSKPNSLLRVKLTADAQWPEIQSLVSCPDLKFPEQVSNIIGVWGLINEMVGDIDRIQKYPDLGYQAKHELPERIVDNWEYLVQNGFTYHLISNKGMQTGVTFGHSADARR